MSMVDYRGFVMRDYFYLPYLGPRMPITTLTQNQIWLNSPLHTRSGLQKIIRSMTRKSAQHLSQCANHLLTPSEVNDVIGIFVQSQLTPFVFSLEHGERHAVYHAPLREGYEIKLAHLFEKERELPLQSIEEMPQDAHVINVSAMGSQEAVNRVVDYVSHHPHLVAYTGIALKEQGLAWLDVHHSEGSKGNGVRHVAETAGYSEIIAFGDGDNDLSLFEVATESYAVSNADDELKELATEVIGHHDEDGVAKFLRKRFDL